MEKSEGIARHHKMFVSLFQTGCACCKVVFEEQGCAAGAWLVFSAGRVWVIVVGAGERVESVL